MIHPNDEWTEKLLLWSFCCTFFFIPIATSPTVIAGALSLGIWILSGKFIRDRQKWLGQEWTLPVILFMLLPWIGLIWSEDPDMGFRLAKKSYYWLYAFAVASISFSKTKALMNSYLAGLAIMAIFSILQYLGLIPMVKVSLGFINPVPYSTLLVFGILLSSYFYKMYDARIKKIFFLLLLAAYFFNLSVSTGKTGYIEFIFLAPFIFYNIFGKNNLMKITAASALIVVILFLSPVAHDRARTVINDARLTYQGNKSGSFGERVHMWESAIKIFLKNPVIGVGTGSIEEALKRYDLKHPNFSLFVQPHNSYLYIASSYGMVGLISFFWLVIVFLKKGWKERKTIAGFSILSYGIVFLIGSLSDSQILSLSTAKMLALLTGLRTEQSE